MKRIWGHLILITLLISALTGGVAIAQVLNAPTLNSPKNDSIAISPTPLFSWYKVTGARKYVLQIARQKDSFSNYIHEITTLDNKWTPAAPLSPGTYKWHVKALRRGVVGNWSPAYVFTVQQAVNTEPVEVGTEQRWAPTTASPIHWQYQLSEPLDISRHLIPGVTVYDIDAFDNPASTVAYLKNRGFKTIAYLSAGTYENWRPDAGRYPLLVLGSNVDGWNGERWLDIRNIDRLAPIIQERLAMAQAKGFDAVEFDNVDAYTQNTGFPITFEDQLKFNKWLAEEAHKKGLAVGLKNDVEQIRHLVDYFDFAVNEQCFQYAEYDTLHPFLSAGKAVFSVEYSRQYLQSDLANSLRMNTLLRDLNLTPPTNAAFLRIPSTPDSINSWTN